MYPQPRTRTRNTDTSKITVEMATKKTKEKKPVAYLIGVIADQDDSWELTAKKDCKAIQFTIPIPGEVLNKAAVRYLNLNLDRFIKLAPSLPDGVSQQN